MPAFEAKERGSSGRRRGASIRRAPSARRRKTKMKYIMTPLTPSF